MILRNGAKQPLQIDRYKVLSQLGKGGFGTIYHVVDKDDSTKEYALKLLHHLHHFGRIQKQLKLLKLLNTSSYFLKTYQSKQVLNKFFLLLEYCPQGNLKKQVKKQVLDEQEAMHILLQLLESLEFLHKNNIIHGDVKAENILQKDERYYLIDFDVIQTKSSVKTLHIQSDDDFTAPEVYRGKQTVASDIYALGCTLYFMLCGKHIYDFTHKLDFSQKMFAHLYATPLSQGIMSDKMTHIILRMVEKDESKRINIQEIREILTKDFVVGVHDKYKIIEDNFTKYERYKFMAEDGVSYAQNIFGLIHEEGINTSKDMQEAIKWYEKASEQGLAKADFNLGLCYKMGRGVAINYQKAKEYFIKASKEGHNRSFYHLGDMYAQGLGVKKDLDESLRYYELSAKHGYKPAYKKL